jgi:hypothetical protein
MFQRGIPETKKEDVSHTFFRRLVIKANLHTSNQGTKTLTVPNAKVYFTTEKKNFDFFLAVTSSDPTNTKDKYLFPITGMMGLTW